VLLGVALCYGVGVSRVTFSMRLDEGLRGRLEARAVLEGRSLANLIERLLELGLGQVVTERDEGRVVAESRRTGVDVDRSVGEGDSRTPVLISSRSVTSCAAAENHVVGTKCLVCNEWPTVVREVKPDWKAGMKR